MPRKCKNTPPKKNKVVNQKLKPKKADLSL